MRPVRKIFDALENQTEGKYLFFLFPVHEKICHEQEKVANMQVRF